MRPPEENGATPAGDAVALSIDLPRSEAAADTGCRGMHIPDRVEYHASYHGITRRRAGQVLE